MNQVQLSLSYHGRAVEEGRLDVYEAAANMIAFSDFVTAAGRAVYGPNVRLKAEVAGFKQGSFVTDVYFQVVLPTLAILPNVDIFAMLKAMKDSLDIWKHLKGEPPKKIESKPGSNDITVTNVNGDVIIVNRPALMVVSDSGGTEAVGRFVQTALTREGIDSLEIKSAKELLAGVTEREAPYFKPVGATIPETPSEVDYVLQIEAPSFRDGNKWQCSDGGSPFFVEMLDEEFLKLVDSGEPFAKGDALRVRLRIEQTRQGAKVSTQRSVLKVHAHIRKHVNGSLF